MPSFYIRAVCASPQTFYVDKIRGLMFTTLPAFAARFSTFDQAARYMREFEARTRAALLPLPELELCASDWPANMPEETEEVE